jgi:hypothetical protein
VWGGYLTCPRWYDILGIDVLLLKDNMCSRGHFCIRVSVGVDGVARVVGVDGGGAKRKGEARGRISVIAVPLVKCQASGWLGVS